MACLPLLKHYILLCGPLYTNGLAISVNNYCTGPDIFVRGSIKPEGSEPGPLCYDLTFNSTGWKQSIEWTLTV